MVCAKDKGTLYSYKGHTAGEGIAIEQNIMIRRHKSYENTKSGGVWRGWSEKPSWIAWHQHWMF